MSGSTSKTVEVVGPLREEDLAAFAVLEQAAQILLVQPDQQEQLLDFYRTAIRKLVLDHTGDATLAARLAIKFAEIIELRRKEIAISAGSNQSGTVQ